MRHRFLPLYLLFIILSGLCISAMAQTQPFNFVMPTTSQNNNTATNISHFTGALGVSVPIYSYKSTSSSLALNVSLDYAGGGLNIFQNASSVGVGWTLSAGGSITRTINGLPDDLVNTGSNAAQCPLGYFWQTSDVDLNPCCWRYQGPGVYTDPANKICRDAEQDNFYYNFNGRQGTLTIPRDAVQTGNLLAAKTTPLSTAHISFSECCVPAHVSTIIGEIIFHDEKGIDYHFGQVETVQRMISSTVDDGNNHYHYNYSYPNEYYVTSWKLTKMVDLNTQEEIDFTYQDYTMFYKQPDFTTQFNNLTTGTVSLYTDNNNEVHVNLKRLTGITFKNGDQVSFIYDAAPRADLVNERALRQIKIQNSIAGPVVTYNLKQAYLNEVSTGGANYTTVETPYENVTATSLNNPNLWFFFKGITRAGLEGYTELPIASFGYYRNTGSYTAANSAVPTRNKASLADSWSYAKLASQVFFGALDTVYNPNGGYTFYDWEQNFVTLPSLFTGYAGGLRVKSVTQFDGVNHTNDLVTQYSYLLADGTSTSGFIPPLPPHSYANSMYNATGGVENYNVELQYNSSATIVPPTLMQGAPAGYRRVKESVAGMGSTVYEFTSLSDYPALYTTLQYPFPNKQLVADWALGLPKMTTIYNEAGNMVKSLQNDYNVTITQLTDPKYRSMKMSYKKEAPGFVLGETTDCNQVATYYQFTYEHYYPYTGMAQLAQTISKEYTPDGNVVTTTSQYAYDPTYYTVTKATSYNSKGEKSEQYPFYLYQAGTQTSSSPAYGYAAAYNLLSTPYGSLTVLTKADNTKYITAYSKNSFKLTPQNLLEPLANYSAKLKAPVAISSTKTTFTPDEDYGVATTSLALDNNFDQYDTYGALTQSTQTKGNVKKSFIWDPVANQISATADAALSDIGYTSFEYDNAFGGWNPLAQGGTITSDRTCPTGTKYYNKTVSAPLTKQGLNAATTYIVSYWSKTGSFTVDNSTSMITGRSISGGWVYYEHTVTNVNTASVSGVGAIDELRVYPKGAQMSTTTYRPLVGVTSECDHNNHITYYEYDGYGRVTLARDQDRNIIKKFCYKYWNETGSCDGSATLYLINRTSYSYQLTITNTSGANYVITVPANFTGWSASIPAGQYNVTISTSAFTSHTASLRCVPSSTEFTVSPIIGFITAGLWPNINLLNTVYVEIAL